MRGVTRDSIQEPHVSPFTGPLLGLMGSSVSLRMADLSGKADPFSEGVEDMAMLMFFLLSN
jgi:hypothetical protein